MTRIRRLARTLTADVVDGVRALRDLLAWGEVQPRAAVAVMARDIQQQIESRRR